MADRCRERGAGLFSTWFGMVIVLVLFLFAVQVLLDLYTRSVVTATAYDAARDVAAYRRGDLLVAEADAKARVQASLGKYGKDGNVKVDFAGSTPDVVKLHVHIDNTHVGFAPINSAIGLDTIDRTVTVRVEKLQP